MSARFSRPAHDGLDPLTASHPDSTVQCPFLARTTGTGFPH